MQTVPLVESLVDLRNLATVAVFLLIIVLGLMSVTRRRRSDKAVLMVRAVWRDMRTCIHTYVAH